MDAAPIRPTPTPVAGCPAGLEVMKDDEVNFVDGLNAPALPDLDAPTLPEPAVDCLAYLEEDPFFVALTEWLERKERHQPRRRQPRLPVQRQRAGLTTTPLTEEIVRGNAAPLLCPVDTAALRSAITSLTIAVAALSTQVAVL